MDFPLATYVRRSPEKVAAWTAVRAALRSGALARQSCEVCGSQKSHAHHDDYDKPLAIRWLCAPHHIAWHVENGQGSNGGDDRDGYYERWLGHDLTGQVFGSLTVIARHGANNAGYRTWVCRCSCGRRVILSYRKLSKSGSHGCDDCRAAWRARVRITRRQIRVTRFEYLGSLYRDNWIDEETDRLRAEFEREFGPLDPPHASCFGSTRTAGLEQFLETAPGGDQDGAILQDIGNFLGITRERARQLETGALEKLRRRLDAVEGEGLPLRLLLGKARDSEHAKVKRPKRRCGVCGSGTHNKRTCPSRAKEAA